MSNAADVVAVGESMALLTPADSGGLADSATLTAAVAGAEGNVASSLARLGHRVAWISALGDDPFGRRILRELADAGVRLDDVRVDPTRPTGVFFKDPDVGGGTSVYYYRSGSAASAMGPDEAAAVRRSSPRVLHLTGITLALSTACADLVTALLADPGTATVSFDVNHRPALWRGRDAAAALRAAASAAGIMFVGRDEAEVLWGTPTAEEIRDLFPDVPTLVVKDADIGATAFRSDERVFVPAPKVDVVEPVGAGDAFAAGFLHGHLRGHDLETSLRHGHELARLALRTHGDVAEIPPEVVDRLELDTNGER